MKSGVKKVVLAYSDGLDTSIILKWLQDEYKCEVTTFTADIGQDEELEPARKKALSLGIEEKDVFIKDLKEESVKDYVFPMFRANTIYEGEYLPGTNIARPLIAKTQAQITLQTRADAVSHGATGKGNDQVHFELGHLAFNSDLKIIAPWHEWDLNSREKLLAYAQKRGIDISKKGEKSPYSVDANLLRISYEGLVLEDPVHAPEEDMWGWSKSPKEAPNESEIIEFDFQKGDLAAISGKRLSPARFLSKLNELGAKHGIGCLDIVENRYVRMKSRGCYETPGGAMLLKAHCAIESITLDREAARLKDEPIPECASLIYNGYWFLPERMMLQALIGESQKHADGRVKLELYKGSVMVIGRESANDSLFDAAYCTFEEDEVYNQEDAAGFIKLNALRFIIAGKNGREF